MSDRDESPPEEPLETKPLGEIQGSRGYGAGKGDIVNLVPPPDDLGLGVPMAPMANDGNPPPSDSQKADASEPASSNDENGSVSVDWAVLGAAIALAILLWLALKDDPRALGIALAAGSTGWFLCRVAYLFPR